MALVHASVEALDGSDALACGFVAFCKGCNGKARVFCHPIYATLSCLFLTAMVKNIYCIYVGYALLPTPPIYATLSCQRPL